MNKVEIKGFISSGIIQGKQMLHSSLIQFIIFVQPIMYGTLMYLMYRNSGQSNFIEYIILGTGLVNLWSSIVYSAANTIERERHIGTLEMLSAMPTKFKTIIGGKITGTVVIGLLSSFNGYLFIILISGERMTIAHPVLFIINLLIIILSFIAISIIMAGVFTLSRQVHHLINTSEYPIFILSGLIFPIENLPRWTRPLSYILSPTWGAKTLRMTVLGIEQPLVYQQELGLLSIITIIYFTIGYFLFKLLMKKIHSDGSLGVA